MKRVEYEGYYIQDHKNMPGMLGIVMAKGVGKIPNVLTGMYTKVEYAKKDIDAYLAYKQEKADAKTNLEGGA